jgi:predicted nucleic acid-binding protein
MNNTKCLIDASAWLAVLDGKNKNHAEAKNYFTHILSSGFRIYTNNTIIDDAIQQLKLLSPKRASYFLDIVDESVLTVNLRLDWLSKRARKNALNQFLKSKNQQLSLTHFFTIETIHQKKIDILFTFDKAFDHLSLPIMPAGKK